MATILDTFWTVLVGFLFDEITPGTIGFTGDRATTVEFWLVTTAGLLAVFYVCYRLFGVWQQQQALRDVLTPVLVTVICIGLRNFIYLIDYSIRLVVSQSYAFNRGMFEAAVWFFVWYYGFVVIRQTVRVPRNRLQRMERIDRVNKIALTVVALFALVFIIMGRSNIVSLLTIIIVIPLMGYISLQLYRESRDNASKLKRIRAEMLYMGYAMIAAYWIFIAIIMVLDLAVFPVTWPYLPMMVIAVMPATSLAISSLCFYWAFVTPNWLRKRHDMLSPSMFSPGMFSHQ